MPEAKITSEWYVAIPIQVRQDMHLDIRDTLEFIKISEGRYEIMSANSHIERIRGIFAKPKKKITLDQMRNAVIRKITSNKY